MGDHEQLQPIGPGAPFRALLEQIGFAELNTVLRQEKEWQRKATHNFATGNVKKALEAYQEKDHVHFNGTSRSMHQLVNDWHNQYTQEHLNLKQILILAHRNNDVFQLNKIARAKRIIAGEITQGIIVNNER